MDTRWFGNVGQISYGVADLAAAVRFWEARMGIGPWLVFPDLRFQAEWEGRAVEFPFGVAMGWHDGRLIELIRIDGAGPSPLHDSEGRPLLGLQRLAAISDDIERDTRAAEARGLERYVSGASNGQRYCYFRAPDAPGLIFELLERTAAFTAFCEGLRMQAEAWQPPAVR